MTRQPGAVIKSLPEPKSGTKRKRQKIGEETSAARNCVVRNLRKRRTKSGTAKLAETRQSTTGNGVGV